MQKKYCTKCGQATEYKSETPSFCSKCGNSFSGKKSTATRSTVRDKSSRYPSEDEDEFEESSSFSSNITSLEFEVEKFPAPNPTIGQVASLGPSEASDKGPKQQEAIAPVDEEKFLKDFQQEAGSIKRRNNG